jgi:hypothetical protein
MAVAAAEMNIELTMTAQSCSTLMNANVDTLVSIVQIDNDLRLPRRVWIIHAPSYIVSIIRLNMGAVNRTIDPGHPAATSLARLMSRFRRHT